MTSMTTSLCDQLGDVLGVGRVERGADKVARSVLGQWRAQRLWFTTYGGWLPSADTVLYEIRAMGQMRCVDDGVGCCILRQARTVRKRVCNGKLLVMTVTTLINGLKGRNTYTLDQYRG